MPTGRARNVSSIVNRTNNCGGNKKAGLAPSVGGRSRFVMKTVMVNAVNTIPVVNCESGGRGCPRNFSNNPGGQACGGVGRMAQLATRGIVPPGNWSRGGGGVPRETITLAAAEAQGGVQANQDLVLRTDDYEDGNNVIGLLIRANETFTVAPGGTITFADPIDAPVGTAAGILVEAGGAFIQQGGTITFEGNISGNAGTGIANGGTFRQEGGTITFEAEIHSTNVSVAGIANNGPGAQFTQAAGTITFQGAITGTNFAAGFNSGSTSIQQAGGAITFKGEITASGTNIDGRIENGIVNGFFISGGTFTQAGAITFESELVGVRVDGISNIATFIQQASGDITFKGAITGVNVAAAGILNEFRFTQAGRITFRGAITSTNDNAFGINNTGNQFTQQTSGAITFAGLLQQGDPLTTADVRLVNALAAFAVNGTIEFPGTAYTDTNFNPNTAGPPIAGGGTITYNNGANTYYQAP